MPREYSPSKHCGSPTKSTGKPCTQWAGAGTDHVGIGPCHMHENGAKRVSQTGPKSAKGKKLASQNARKHGLYATVVTPEERLLMQELAQTDPTLTHAEGVALVNARILRLIVMDDTGSWTKNAGVVWQTVQALRAEGKIDSDDFVNEVYKLLKGFDMDRMIQSLLGAGRLALQGNQFRKEKTKRAQLYIFSNFYLAVMNYTTDEFLIQEGLRTLELLKLEAGMPLEDWKDMVAEIYPDRDCGSQS